MVSQTNNQRTVYIATATGLLVGLIVVGLFYLCEKESFTHAVHHVFGGETNEETSFSLPQRTRPIVLEEKANFSEHDARPSWFEEDNLEFHSAVLIAGSQGYGNYRHQADLCHAFQILKAGGMPQDQIITFIFDDIAHHPKNPYPGQIFNRPGGENVYPGCAKDYTGYDVNRENVLAVLEGNAEAVAGKGSGRVLRRDSRQKVFIFYTDHGSVGNIGMPVGPPIYADELNAVLNSMAERDHFDEMLIYLEACDSGSMFQDFKLDQQRKILAVTAAKPFEHSYATYCPASGYQTRITVPNATYIGSCLGDLFSVSWMEDTERVDRAEVLVEEQVDRVRFRTSNYDMYMYGSHVIQYGDQANTIATQIIGNFMSYFAAPSGWTRSDTDKLFGGHANNNKGMDFAVNQHQADLLYLYHLAYENADGDASRELEAELNRRRQVDADVRAVIQHLIHRGQLPEHSSTEAYATQRVEFGPQVVGDYSCLRGMVQEWEMHCQPMDTYARQYTRTFANLCNAGVTPFNLLPSLIHVCQSPNKLEIYY